MLDVSQGRAKGDGARYKSVEGGGRALIGMSRSGCLTCHTDPVYRQGCQAFYWIIYHYNSTCYTLHKSYLLPASIK